MWSNTAIVIFGNCCNSWALLLFDLISYVQKQLLNMVMTKLHEIDY